LFVDPSGNSVSAATAAAVAAFLASPPGQQFMQQITVLASQAGQSVTVFVANNLPAIQQLINQAGSVAPAVYDYFASGQAGRDLAAGFNWKGYMKY